MLDLLEDFGFIIITDEKVNSTVLGKRVSQLYIDPLTANEVIEALKKLHEVKINEFTFLHLICSTLEMRPLFNVSAGEYDIIEENLSFNTENTVIRNNFEHDYYLNIAKTALVLKDWINEKTEQDILEAYNVRPGELNYKLETADWLFYSIEEIAKIVDKENLREEIIHVMKIRKRLKYGIKEELLELVRLRNIGKIRARSLYRAGFKTSGSLKIADPEILSGIVGSAISRSIKEQLGIKVKEKGLEKY